MTMFMKEITATRFKAHCLRLLDEVAATGEPLTITKHGRPVARVEPPTRRDDLRGSVKQRLTDAELVNASMGAWDVERE
jgi:prevent-host-death family protein